MRQRADSLCACTVQTFLCPKTKLPGLYLTGQDVLCNGISGAQTSGLVTVMAMSTKFALTKGISFLK